MKFLIDTSATMLADTQSSLVAGQLLTPLTNYKCHGGAFAIDNGAFSGFDRNAFFRLLSRNENHMERCLFVAVPDVVGSARRTKELYFQFTQYDEMKPWAEKWAMVMQDGMEDMQIEWFAVRHLFVGGTNDFKDSHAAYDIVKVAVALGIPVHVGRVNTWKRFKIYEELGASTCDGSGIAKYDHMLREVERRKEISEKASKVQQESLFGEPSSS